jgi:hypothetical protein
MLTVPIRYQEFEETACEARTSNSEKHFNGQHYPDLYCELHLA